MPDHTGLKNARILITGGAGFIGSNMVDYFLAKGNQVVCLDNFATGSRANLRDAEKNADFKLIEGDIRNPDVCKEACDGVDFVFHEAALGSVPRSILDPITTNDVNIGGFVNMIKSAADAKVKRFIYASSSSVYGSNTALPKREENIGKPLSPYAVTKHVNELYGDLFSEIYGIETIGLRYFNVFGKRQDPNGAYAAVIPRFAIKLIAHESPVINGDGYVSRDFTHIDNVLKINEKAALANRPEALNRIYNAACGERTTLFELFQMLRRELSKFDREIMNVEPEFGPPRKGDILHSLADVSLAGKLLGYEVRKNVGDGIAEAAEWYFKTFSK